MVNFGEYIKLYHLESEWAFLLYILVSNWLSQIVLNNFLIN